MSFDYAAEPKEEIALCNLCGPKAPPPYRLARRDRYRLPVTTMQCARCGLVWISPRMKPEGYRRFYESGEYRRWLPAHTPERLDQDQAIYGRRLKTVLSGRARKVLDVGGSAGGVARLMGEDITVLDPAANELPRGGLALTVEEWEPADQYDLILCCRTLDHVLDPLGALRKFRAALAPGGRVWVDVVQWQLVASWTGTVEGAMKLDHPFAFMEGNFLLMLEAAGLWAMTRASCSRQSVGYVCVSRG